MGRRGSGEAGAFALSVARAIESLCEDAGMTKQELAEAAGMSRSYFYKRMRGEYPFGLNDIEVLAAALKVHPAMITALAVSNGDDYAGEVDPSIHVDPAELSRRLRKLQTAPLADGTDYIWDELANAAIGSGVLLTREEFESLLTGERTEPVRLSWLTLIAKHWTVPEAFLSDFDDKEAAEATLAQLEFRIALRESGATSISARAVGDISPAALRAITASLRSIRP